MERDRGYVQIVHTWIPEGNDPFVCWPLWACVEELRTYWYMRIVLMLRIYVVIVFVSNPIQYMFISSFSTFSMQKRFPLQNCTPKTKKTPPLFRGGIARLVAKLLWLEPGHPDLDSEIQGEKLCEQKRGGYVDNLDDHPPFFWLILLWVHSLKQVSKFCAWTYVFCSKKGKGLSSNHPFLGAKMLVSGQCI